MPRKTQDPSAQLDDALGDVLSGGWDTPPDPEPVEPPAPASIEAVWSEHRNESASAAARVVKPDGEIVRFEDLPLPPEDDDEPKHPLQGESGMLSMGLLADLAAGRATPEQAAARSGVDVGQLDAALALTLRDMEPADIAKALNLQAVEQQLKSGALYGAVLHALTLDLATGKMPATVKIELAKLLGKNGRIEPKEEKAQAGGGFVLNISLGAAAQPVTIESN